MNIRSSGGGDITGPVDFSRKANPIEGLNFSIRDEEEAVPK